VLLSFHVTLAGSLLMRQSTVSPTLMVHGKLMKNIFSPPFVVVGVGQQSLLDRAPSSPLSDDPR
jgi:hypothetical protein